MFTFQKRFFAAILVSSLMLVGCGGKSVVKFEGHEAPAWVLKGSGAFDTAGKQVFYGVGSASNIKNFALRRKTAENRARNEIAQTFKVYTSSLMKDYMASTTAGDMSATSEEQHIEQVIKTVTSTTLSGVQIVDTWMQPNDSTIFSLAKVDLADFEQNLQKMKELNSSVKKFVKENAKKLHEELAIEEEKANDR